jgi:lysyl-tRNA synthetase class 2
MSEHLEDIISFRKKKLENLVAAGQNPYPSSTNRTHEISDVLENFEKLSENELTIVGRIRSLRLMGQLAFAHIDDGEARMQILLQKAEVGDEAFDFFANNFDIGDFIEATGKLFTTKSGEKTVQAGKVRMLAKSLRPLPTEHFGIADEEIKLRQRYLDILLNPETKDLFVKKAIFWDAIREFLKQHGFLEMYMPVLEAIPGGAEAEPFITHHKALDKDFYLRISLELPLKKMLVAGYPKVFEIGRIFRNEGIDREHLQDYTQMEWYWAFGDFEGMMKFVQEMYQFTIMKTFGTLQLSYQGQIIDWSGNWSKLDYFELFKKYTNLDLNTITEDDLRAYMNEHHLDFEKTAGKGRLIDLIFKKTIRILPEVSMQPHFLINQPIEIEPLAKKDEKNPKVVQRMQILACGSEMGKGFGELNDPIDQAERFAEQMKLREKGDSEAQMLDTDYLEAMEYGMPPAAGFGLSERTFAIFNDRSVRETVVFPPMKDA